jgi:hypothetical protein
MVDGQVILVGFCLGAAGLGLWVAVRFPSFGPQRVATAIITAIAATAVLPIAASLFDVAAGFGRYAVGGGLLVIILPALTFAFWAAACALRALSRHGLHA